MSEPPHLARRLLGLIPQPDREFIEGDLDEEYAVKLQLLGRERASTWYWRQVLASLPWLGLDAAIKALTSPITVSDLQRRILAMASVIGGAPTPRRPAFGSRLIASKPPRVEGAFATGTMSMIFHVAMLGGLVLSTVGNQVPEQADPTTVIEMVSPLAESEPPPPPPPDADAAPVEAAGPEFVVPEQIPIEIPPPGVGPITSEGIMESIMKEMRDTADNRTDGHLDIGATPTFTPFEVAPGIQNLDEIGRALQREYPTLLRDAGVGGRVEVWIRLDERGSVQDVQVNASSGQPSLDDAALRVARIIEFSPAMNRDKAVPVWVSIPITFKAL